MSRFKPFDVIYANFPYGGVMTDSPHPALVLNNITDTDGNEYIVIAAGTTAVDKDTFELKHKKGSNEILLTSKLLDDAGLIYPTLFKFKPITFENGKMNDGTILTIPLDSDFLSVCPRTKRTRIGKIDPHDCLLNDQFRELNSSTNVNKIMEDSLNLFIEHGFDFLYPNPNPTPKVNKEEVADRVNKMRLNKYKEKKISKKP